MAVFYKINRFQSIKRFSRFVAQNERQKYVIHQVKEEFIIIYQLSNICVYKLKNSFSPAFGTISTLLSFFLHYR